MSPRGLTDISRHKWRDAGWDALYRTMKAAITAFLVDDQLARIMAVLEATGQLDNTLILFTDHGEHLGDFGFVGNALMQHAGANVGPIAGRFAASARCDLPASLVDSTDISGAAGLAADESPVWIWLTSHVVLSDLTGHESDERIKCAACLVEKEWKYAWSAGDCCEYLFDRRTDPRDTPTWPTNLRCRNARYDARPSAGLLPEDGQELIAAVGPDPADDPDEVYYHRNRQGYRIEWMGCCRVNEWVSPIIDRGMILMIVFTVNIYDFFKNLIDE